MTSNAVVWLLLCALRDGTSLESLVHALDTLRDSLALKGRGTGFSGASMDVAKHAVSNSLRWTGQELFHFLINIACKNVVLSY